MQARWIALTLVLGLLLTGCGKTRKDQETTPVQNQTPVLTEAPTVLTEAMPEETMETVDATAETGEETEATEAPTEAEEPKDDPNQEPVNETVYAVAKVNVRDKAGFQSKVIGQLEGGESVTRTGIGKKGWSRILYDGRTAYVANNYLTTDSPETAGGATFKEVNQTVKATDKVNVRKGPGVDYEILGQLQHSQEVKRTAIGDKGWSRIKFGDQNAYVANNYLKVVTNDAVPEEVG